MEADKVTCASGTRPRSQLRDYWQPWLSCLIVVCLAGCASLPPPESPEPLHAITAPDLERLPPRVIEQPPVDPQPAPAPVAIIVSSQLPAYQDVAHSLADMLAPDEYLMRVLDPADESLNSELVSSVNAANPRVVVAIGLDAALLAREGVDAPLVFCQVFNYADYPELEQATAGVSMLAAFDEQLAFWKAIDESLGTVGTIVGHGHEELIAESAAAAAAQGITLDARVSDSDRETVYQFKRLAAEIDGFWLIPDNRILSLSAIEELMRYAAARRLPVVVSTPELLRFGALMSLKPSPAHVANTVYSVLDRLQSYVADGFEIVTPRSFEVDVNPGVATRLGIGVD